jgi:menaquinone-dependent protoporphyrinogen IX oxidase
MRVCSPFNSVGKFSDALNMIEISSLFISDSFSTVIRQLMDSPGEPQPWRWIWVVKLLVGSVVFYFVVQQFRTSLFPVMGFDVGLFIFLLSAAFALNYLRQRQVNSIVRYYSPGAVRETPLTLPVEKYTSDLSGTRNTRFAGLSDDQALPVGEPAGKRILVTYASSLGSTPAIAREIGNELRKAGQPVEVADMKRVLSLENYYAVVIGVPIYTGFAGLGEIGNFTKKRFSQELARVPVAVFAVGLAYWGMDPDSKSIMTNVKGGLFPIVPVSSVLFVGILDPKKLSLLQRFANIAHIPSADFQDWDMIRAWAGDLPDLLNEDETQNS